MILYFVIVSALLFRGLLARDAFTLFVVSALLAPLGLLATAALKMVSTIAVRAKSRQIAEALRQAASSLELDTPDLVRFDHFLEFSCQLPRKGVISPYLLGSARLTRHIGTVLLSEWSRRVLESKTDEFIPPIRRIATHLKEVATAIDEEDPVKTLTAIGQLMARYYEFLQETTDTAFSPYDTNAFIRDCDEISMFLRQGQTSYAVHKFKEVLELCVLSVSRDEWNWRLVVASWLRIKLSALASDPNGRLSAPWISPSRLLALQLDVVTSSLAVGDLSAVSDIVYESFELHKLLPWRLR